MCLTKKGIAAPQFLSGPWLLWPNGWMDEDATWYGGRPRPMGHCVYAFRWKLVLIFLALYFTDVDPELFTYLLFSETARFDLDPHT